MHSTLRPYDAYRLIHRDGTVWPYRDLTALVRELVTQKIYLMGQLNGTIAEGFSTWICPDTGRRFSNGDYVVEDENGDRISRAVILKACVAYAIAHRRRSNGRRWHYKPRRFKIVTQADRRHAIFARADLREIDERFVAIIEPNMRIDDPYEARPRRTPQRSWKSHRAHQHH